MKKLLISAVLLATSAACADSPVTAPSAHEGLLTTAMMAGGAHHSRADIYTFAMDHVDGWSKITRNWSGVAMTLHTSDLVPGNAYTMWAVIFNVPGECSGECGEDDLFNPAAVVDVVYVAGNIVGRKGTATFAGRRAVGDNSKSLFAALGVPAPGLEDAHGAEVHLIVRDHGKALPGGIPAQIHTFEGACTPESSFGLGDGPNECADVQFSVHLP